MAGNIIELHTEVPAELEANVFGQFDEHLKLIERTLNVTVISRDGILKILGNEQNAASAKKPGYSQTGIQIRSRGYGIRTLQ